MAAVARERPADFLGDTVAAVLAAIGGNHQTVAGIASAVADGQIADAVRPGVVGVKTHTAADPLLQGEDQAVVAGRAAVVILIDVGDEVRAGKNCSH